MLFWPRHYWAALSRTLGIIYIHRACLEIPADSETAVASLPAAARASTDPNDPVYDFLPEHVSLSRPGIHAYECKAYKVDVTPETLPSTGSNKIFRDPDSDMGPQKWDLFANADENYQFRNPLASDSSNYIRTTRMWWRRCSKWSKHWALMVVAGRKLRILPSSLIFDALNSLGFGISLFLTTKPKIVVGARTKSKTVVAIYPFWIPHLTRSTMVQDLQVYRTWVRAEEWCPCLLFCIYGYQSHWLRETRFPGFSTRFRITSSNLLIRRYCVIAHKLTRLSSGNIAWAPFPIDKRCVLPIVPSHNYLFSHSQQYLLYNLQSSYHSNIPILALR